MSTPVRSARPDAATMSESLPYVIRIDGFNDFPFAANPEDMRNGLNNSPTSAKSRCAKSALAELTNTGCPISARMSATHAVAYVFPVPVGNSIAIDLLNIAFRIANSCASVNEDICFLSDSSRSNAITV